MLGWACAVPTGEGPDQGDCGDGGGNERDEAFPAVEHERKDSLFLSYAYQVS